MSRAPVHAGLAPVALIFVEADDAWARAIAAACAAIRVEAATGGGKPAGCWRLTAATGERWFARVVPAELAGVAEQTARLAARLAATCPEVPAPLGPPRPLPQGFAAFVWPWLDGGFARGAPHEMRTFGRCVARLHAVLRREHARAPWLEADALWQAQWSQLEALARGPELPPPAATALRRLLQDRAAVTGRLRAHEQPLHNDLHPGNVFFDAAGDVQAVFDWEEALRSAGSPWIDLAWVVERFCALPTGDLSVDRAAAFLQAWQAERTTVLPPPAGVLHDAMCWRSLRALALLAGAPDGDAPIAAERDKFVQLLDRLAGWQPLLAQLEQQGL